MRLLRPCHLKSRELFEKSNNVLLHKKIDEALKDTENPLNGTFFITYNNLTDDAFLLIYWAVILCFRVTGSGLIQTVVAL